MARVFNESEKNEILAALTNAGAKGTCSNCGGQNILMESGVAFHFAPMEIGGGNSPGVGSFVITCGNCGLLTFYNAYVLKLGHLF